MTKHTSSDRRPWWGAGLCILTLGAAACSGHSDNVSQAATSTTAASVVVARTTPAPTTTASPAAPAPAATGAPAPLPDPAATLQGALASLTTTYHFVSTVTLDGAVALVADGDRVGDGSRLTLTSGDGKVSYLITPDGSWVMPDGGDWQPLDTDPADADPIG